MPLAPAPAASRYRYPDTRLGRSANGGRRPPGAWTPLAGTVAAGFQPSSLLHGVLYL